MSAQQDQHGQQVDRVLDEGDHARRDERRHQVHSADRHLAASDLDWGWPRISDRIQAGPSSKPMYGTSNRARRVFSLGSEFRDLPTASRYEPITLADGTVLTGCRPDLLSLGDLMARGWSIIPLQPRSKLPAVRWEPYQHRLATPAELESWFTYPGNNIGIVTGTISGIFVVDIDSEAALAWAQHQLPPCDLRVRTSKGEHRYYQFSGDCPMRNRCRVSYQGESLDIDIRATGGYVVGPGSVHPDGHVYTREGVGWTWS